MKAKKILRIVLAVLAAAIIGGCIYINSLMPIITGYAAKNLASDVFVSGRNAADIEALDLNFSFIKFTRNKVDYENKTVTSRFLWGKSTAAWREGYGVTLLRGKSADELRAEKFPLAPEPDSAVAAFQTESVRLRGAPQRQTGGRALRLRRGRWHQAPQLEHGQEFHQCPHRHNVRGRPS